MPSTSGCDDVARLRPLHGDHGPLLGDRGEPDVEMRELGLEVVLHVVHDARRAAGRRRDMETVGRQASDDAVVIDEAVLAQHDAVAAAARLELLPRVGVEQLHELRRVRADHLDLAERRGVEQAGSLAHGHAFAVDGGVHVLAGSREIPGAFPLADILEHRAIALPPRHGSAVLRVGSNSAPARMVDDRAEGNRRIGRAERRQPDLGDRLAQRLGGNGQSMHVGRLALVGRHAVGGEALDVLDRAHALMHRLADVLGGHVVLEIDEGLDGRVRRRRPAPRRACRRPSSRWPRPSASTTLPTLAAGLLRRFLAGRMASSTVAPARPCRCRRRPKRSPAHRRRAGSACVASSKATLPRDCENRCTDGVQPADISSASTGIVRSRAAGLRLDRHGGDAQPAADFDHGAAVIDLDAERARLVDQPARRIVAQIDDRRDVDAGLLQVDRRGIGGIVRRVDADIPADRDAIVVEVGARRRGQHHAGTVVVGKHHVPLDGAGGEDHAPGAHLPQPLARQVVAGIGEMVGDALDEPDEILRVVAEGRRARQHADIVHGRELRDRSLRPGPAVVAVDRGAGSRSAARRRTRPARRRG